MADEMVGSCCVSTLFFQLAYDDSPILHSNASDAVPCCTIS